MSEDYLPLIFESFYKKIERADTFYKGRYYELVHFLNVAEIDKEIENKLNAILQVINWQLPFDGIRRKLG